ncbi:MAG: MscL family protein, partial [Muribaculaceae bacterium]|nr:MscL family protein [Muribaculaceae bacterium]
IIAFCIFIAIRVMQKMRRKKEEDAPAPAPAGPSQEELLTEIRDLLAKQAENKK